MKITCWCRCRPIVRYFSAFASPLPFPLSISRRVVFSKQLIATKHGDPPIFSLQRLDLDDASSGRSGNFRSSTASLSILAVAVGNGTLAMATSDCCVLRWNVERDGRPEGDQYVPPRPLLVPWVRNSRLEHVANVESSSLSCRMTPSPSSSPKKGINIRPEPPKVTIKEDKNHADLEKVTFFAYVVHITVICRQRWKYRSGRRTPYTRYFWTPRATTSWPVCTAGKRTTFTRPPPGLGDCSSGPESWWKPWRSMRSGVLR